MEVLLLLGNFVVMLLLVHWSGRAERLGKKAAHGGLFGYTDIRRKDPAPPPRGRGGAGRVRPPGNVPPHKWQGPTTGL